MSDRQPHDRPWFRALYPGWHSKVSRFVTRSVPIKETAEDLTNETFQRVWECREKIPDEQDRQIPYVLGIARNVVKDYLRKHRQELAELVDVVEFESVPSGDGDIAQRVADELDMRRAFGRLGRNDQILLWQYYCDEATAEELARQFGTTVDAVYKRVERARERLRRQLKRNNVLEGRPIHVRRS